MQKNNIGEPIGGRESFKLWALYIAARFSDYLTPPLSEAPWLTFAFSLALDTCSLHFHPMTLSVMSLIEQERAREILPVPTITNLPLLGFLLWLCFCYNAWTVQLYTNLLGPTSSCLIKDFSSEVMYSFSCVRFSFLLPSFLLAFKDTLKIFLERISHCTPDFTSPFKYFLLSLKEGFYVLYLFFGS